MSDLNKLTAEESPKEMLARVRMMASGTDDTWDLSDNDVLALGYVLERLEKCEAEAKMWQEAHDFMNRKAAETQVRMEKYEAALQMAIGFLSLAEQEAVRAALEDK